MAEKKDYVLVLRVTHKENERSWSSSDARSYSVNVEVRATKYQGSDDYVADYVVSDSQRDMLKIKTSASLYLWKPENLESVKGETVNTHDIKWDVEYDREIGLGEAQKAVKTLGMVERKLEALRQQEGYPKSFGQAVNRLARALGVKHMMMRSKRHECWVWYGLGDMPGMIDHIFENWRYEIVQQLEGRQVA